MLSSVEHVVDDQKTANARSIIQFMGSVISKPDFIEDKGSAESYDGESNQMMVDLKQKEII